MFLAGLNVETALISPMVPIEIRSSGSSSIPWYFFTNMGHQPQVPLDQNIFRLRITLQVFAKIKFFLIRGERFLECFQEIHLKRDFLLFYVMGQNFVLFQQKFPAFPGCEPQPFQT